MIEVIPGINEKNFDDISFKIRLVENYVSWIQIDIMDNTLVHNDTYNNFGVFKGLQTPVKFEAHLMVADPRKYIQPLVDSGFKRLIAHAEGTTIRDFMHEAKTFPVETGVALDSVSDLGMLEPFLDEADVVLIMTAKAGVSGQDLDPLQLSKIKKLHQVMPILPVGVDGGINKETAGLCIENGAVRLVTTSYLFDKNKDRIPEAIEELKQI